MMQIYSKNKDFYFGLIYSVLVFISAFDNRIVLPLIIVGSIIYFSKTNISKDYLQLSYLLITKITLIILIFLMFKFQYDISYLAEKLATSLILLCLLFFKPPAKFVNGLFFGIIILFFINTFFNLCLLFIGSDPFGRLVNTRSGEIIPRFTGIYGHPYLSTYINFLALYVGSIKKNRVIILITSITCIFTGSIRSWTLFLTFIVSYFSLKNFTKNKVIIIMILLAIFFISSNILFMPEGSANFIRVFAWQNSLQKIIENPIFGNHDFSNYKFDGVIDGINSDRILDLGIAENQYLQLMQDYGIFVGILHLLIFNKLLIIILNRFYKNPNNHFYLMQSVFICVGFSDNFYGGLMANIIVCTVFCITNYQSFDNSKKNQKLTNFKKMTATNFT